MKNTIKILRSIATSLLFIMLTVAVIIVLVFASINLSSPNFPSMIDREEFLNEVLDYEIEDETTKSIALDYLNDYINYIFHKRSYPSLQTIDYKDMTGEDKIEAQRLIEKLSDRICLEYNSVLAFRKINNITSNRAIFLIMSIGLFLILVVTFIMIRPFLRGLKFSLGAFSLGSFLTFLLIPLALSKAKTIITQTDYDFLSAILNPTYFQTIRRLTLSLTAIFTVIFILIILGQKFIIPRLDKQL